jgi:hypothetical protein
MDDARVNFFPSISRSHGGGTALSSLLAALLLSATGVHGLELADSKWGFDGTLLPGKVNVVSAKFFNPDAQPFDGTVTLVRSTLLNRQGATHEAKIYVSPQTYRWVQFLVEPSSTNERFEIRYPLTPKRDETKVFEDIKLGTPARVMLVNAADTSALSPRIPSFPAEAFPASVIALEGLEQLVLDFKPDWDAPRRQALLDWVHLGGVVHLLKDREGKNPVFEGELQALNIAESRGRVGAGHVVVHEMSRRDLTDETLDASGFPRSDWAKRTQEYYGYHQGHTGAILRHLRQMIRPHHPWALINMLLLAYIGLIGPGQYFLVKKCRLDYRLSLLMLAALVAVFSVVFYQIGLRGYRNPSMVLSVAKASILPGNRAAFTQWSQAFTRKSHEAAIRHAGASGMYDTPGSDERLSAVARNGAQAELAASMPVNSTLPFVWRGVSEVPGVSIKRAGAPGEIAFDYQGPKILAALYMERQGTMVQRLKAQTDTAGSGSPLRLFHAASETLANGVELDQYYGMANVELVPGQGLGENQAFVRQYLGPYLARVIREACSLTANDYESKLEWPDWKKANAQVFIAVDAGPENRTIDPHFTGHVGITILHFVLPPP